ncbi:MAG TPA: spondin domain-containing protein [Rubricoccaceae bacterium]|nr:spondin domain-containing protein [Rubricoccaceae bacterium]
MAPPAASRALLLMGLVATLTACDTAGDPDPVEDPTATYEVLFTATWSAQTHPTEFPANAHFSPLVGAVHNDDVSLWAVGRAASIGIQRMAERGRTDSLAAEAAREPGTFRVLVDSAALSTGYPSPSPPGQAVRFGFAADHEHPLVTLVTMVAPSPDWFIGVSGFDLRPNGQWVDAVTVPLVVYDAGTDSGQTYTAPDEPTVPRGVVHVSDHPYFLTGGQPGGEPTLVGVFQFIRVGE